MSFVPFNTARASEGLVLSENRAEVGPGGAVWKTVQLEEQIPRGRRFKWKTIVERVVQMGDVIIGLQDEDGRAYCYYCVTEHERKPTIVGVSESAGTSWSSKAESHMVHTRNYGPQLSAPLSTAEVELTAVWTGKAIEFSRGSENYGVAFSVGTEPADIPSDANLHPFVTLYGQGTAVRIEMQPAHVQLARQYALAMGKVIAGTLKFIFEDCLQGFCQCVYICKDWNKVSLYTQIFTMCSISSGVLLSVIGPLREFLTVSALQSDAKAKNAQAKLRIDAEEQQHQLQQTQQLSVNPEAEPLVVGKDENPAERFVEHMRIVDFLTGKAQWRTEGSVAHKTLLVLASLFWFWMVALRLWFREDFSCRGGPPLVYNVIFFASSVVDLCMQAFVIRLARQDWSKLFNMKVMVLLGCALSVVGRFDTYGDIVFNSKINNCESITWFSIRERKFHLPCDLATISNIGLAVGVFAIQALPGIVLLLQKRLLSVAFKMNEFNLLLVFMELESVD